MTDFNFSVGTALTLQLLRDRDAPRIQAKVLGFKRGESVMVDVAGPAFSPIDLTVATRSTYATWSEAAYSASDAR